MLSRILSLVALVTMIALLAISLPNYINSFNTTTPVTSIVMSGLVVLCFLTTAIMLLLFGVLGMGSKPAAK